MAKVKVNYRNNKRSILTSFILILCLGFSLMMVVYAGGTNSQTNAGGGNSSYPSSSTTPGLKYSVYAIGVRVALVDQAGDVVEGSKVMDIWGKDVITNSSEVALRDKEIRVLTNGNISEGEKKMLRQEVVKTTNINYLTPSGKTFTQLVTLNNNQGLVLTKWDDSYPWWINHAAQTVRNTKNNTGVIITIIDFLNYRFSNCKTGEEEGCGSATGSAWVDIVLGSLDSPQNYQQLLDKYVSDGGNLAISDPNDLNSYNWIKNSLTDRYIQFEPLVIVRYANRDNYNGAHWFYGTITEAVYHETLGSSVISGAKSGIYIQKGKKMPTPFHGADGVTSNSADMKDPLDPTTVGQGVGHIYLGDFLKKPDCETALSQIIAKYGQGTEKYHEMVELLATTGFEDIFPDKNGNMVKTVVGKQNYNLLIRANYDKADNPYGQGVAACKDYNPVPPPSCNPEADVKVDECTGGHSWFKDTENSDDWLVCGIAYVTEDGNKYSSENTGHEAIEDDYYGVVGNEKYCEIFCTEKVESFFPGKVTEVKAGQTFLWGQSNGEYGRITVEKTCSTRANEYKYSEWNDEYLANEKSLIKNYLLWQAYEEAIIYENIPVTVTPECCDWVSKTCGSGDDEYDCSYCADEGHDYTATLKQYTNKYKPDIDKTDAVGTSSGGDSWMISFSETNDSATHTVCSSSDATNEAKAGAVAIVLDKLSAAETAFDIASGHEKEQLYYIFQCFSNMKYVYETVVYFIFEEPVNSVYGKNTRSSAITEKTWELVKEATKDVTEDDNFKDDKCKQKEVYSYVCDGDGDDAECKVDGIVTKDYITKDNRTAGHHLVLDCETALWEIEGEYIYSYPIEEFQWFSDKRDSTLVNEKSKPSGDDAYFYSIGFGLPTAFSLTSGKYEMAVVVGNLGDHAEISKGQTYNKEDGHFGPLADAIENVEINGKTISIDEVKGFEYKCTYSVENEIFGYDCQYNGTVLTSNSPAYCDPSEDNNSNGTLAGIDVVYRLVSLLDKDTDISVAFPGINGGGRTMGENWANLDINEIYDVLDSSVYNGKNHDNLAMYEIMLDINAIRYIRKNNNEYWENGKDPYTSFVDEYNHQKVYCKSKGSNNEDKYCASEFLTELNTSSALNYNLMGTCLPSGMGTEERAQHVLDNDCTNTYIYPKISWVR